MQASSSSMGQQIFPPNYSVHQPQNFSSQSASNLSVQPPYDHTHYASASLPMRSNSALPLSSYQPVPISDGAINAMTSSYAQASSLALETAELSMPFKSDYGSALHNSGLSTPDNSVGHSASTLSFDGSEPLQPLKRQRTDASSSAVTLPRESIGSEFDHHHEPIGDAPCWAFDDFSSVTGLPVSMPFSPSNIFYNTMPNLVDSSQLWQTHINTQQYSI